METTGSPPASGPTGAPGSPVGVARPGVTGPPPADPPADPVGGLSGDWPAQAADAIVDLVGVVRDKTTGPITRAARAVVFGLFAALVAVAVTVLAIIALIRLLDEVLPSGVWLAYLLLGLVFVGLGGLVYRKRRVPTGP